MAPAPSARLVALLLAPLAALCGCGAEPTEPVDAAGTHFTVRGRWPDRGAITWRAETTAAPIAQGLWQDAVARACDTWSP